MRYAYLDSETTGLLQDNLPLDDERQPWPVEIGCILTDDYGDTASAFHCVIKPEYWVIPPQARAIHGIDHTDALKHGIRLQDVLTFLRATVIHSSAVVCYNADFDAGIIEAASVRLGVQNPLESMNVICAMREFSNYHNSGRVSLRTAFEMATGDKPSASHSAMSDARSCRSVHQWILDRERQKEKVNPVLVK